MDLMNMSFENKVKLSRNLNTPPNVLHRLAKENDAGIKGYVARNFNTTEDTLGDLAKDTLPWVRWHVATNPKTPLNLLKSLAQDWDWNIRRAMIEHPNISSTVLVMILEKERSLRSPSCEVIRKLYHHSKLPHIAKIVIETLYGDIL